MEKQAFEYGGFHFIPERRFTAEENSFLAISRRQRLDKELGFCKPGYDAVVGLVCFSVCCAEVCVPAQGILQRTDHILDDTDLILVAIFQQQRNILFKLHF